MLCLRAMFRVLKRNMDGELELIVVPLMSKVAERNFLADEADETLKTMCDTVSETRYVYRSVCVSVLTILTFYIVPSARVCVCCSQCYDGCTEPGVAQEPRCAH